MLTGTKFAVAALLLTASASGAFAQAPYGDNNPVSLRTTYGPGPGPYAFGDYGTGPAWGAWGMAGPAWGGYAVGPARGAFAYAPYRPVARRIAARRAWRAAAYPRARAAFAYAPRRAVAWRAAAYPGAWGAYAYAPGAGWGGGWGGWGGGWGGWGPGYGAFAAAPGPFLAPAAWGAFAAAPAPAAPASPDNWMKVYEVGKLIGQDPDPNVRMMLAKDFAYQ